MGLLNGSEVWISCCDFWGNGGGDWVGGIEPLAGTSGNISEDPLFCNPDYAIDYGDLRLQPISPCALRGACEPMGSRPIGCEGPAAVFHHWDGGDWIGIYAR